MHIMIGEKAEEWKGISERKSRNDQKTLPRIA
jgi:hypothetical protein